MYKINQALLLKDVAFSYGEKMVLTDINLSVMAGSRIGLVGTSGCGKSTLLKLIAGLYAVSKGYIEVLGENKPDKIRRNIAMVMQNAMLFPTSIRENITCGHPMEDNCIWAACEAAQLTDWIMTLPEKLDTFLGERGNRLSGGQGQRIAIARAIAKDAPVVLLDEATSALDGQTEQAVLVAIHHLMQGKTVISVTHRIDTLEGFDAIYRMEEGKIYNEKH